MIPAEYQEFAPAVTVACSNFERGITKKDSLARIESDMHAAAARGVNILVFPELALTGIIDCSCRFDGFACRGHLDLAETVPGPASAYVAKLARDFDLYVVFGMTERDPADPSVLYNAAAVVGPDGILGTYRKLHLGTLPATTEGITCRPGSTLPLFATRFGPVGVLIGEDFSLNPELSRILMLKGARVLLNPAAIFKGPGRREALVQNTSVRAQENLVYAATANLVGGAERAEYSPDQRNHPRAEGYVGHSLIAGPAYPRFSAVFAEAGENAEIVSATLRFEELHRWEAELPMRQWRAGRQLAASRLIADEFAALAENPAAPGPEAATNRQPASMK